MRSSIDLETLKKLCFKQNLDPSLNERYRRSWAMYYPLVVTHFISIRVVRLLYPTPVSPNTITWLSYLTGWTSCFFFLKPGAWVLAGALCFELFYVLDAVDGQLARARGSGSRGGAFLDDWANFLVPPVILFAIGMRPEVFWVRGWTAFFASFSVMTVSIIELLKDRLSPARSRGSAAPAAITSRHPVKILYSFVYRSCTMPVIMNLVTIASVLEAFGVREPVSGLSYPAFLVYYFAVAGPLVALSKGAHTARTL